MHLVLTFKNMDASLAGNRVVGEHQEYVSKTPFIVKLIHDLNHETFGESGESGKTEAELAKFALKIRNKLHVIHLEEEDVKMAEKGKLAENTREELLRHFRYSRRRNEIRDRYNEQS